MPSRPLRSVSLLALLFAGLASCELPAPRTGSCQPSLELAVGTFERGESFHNDCRAPSGYGDIFTMVVDSQANLVLNVTPEGGFIPTLAIFSGTFGAFTEPKMVAELSSGFQAQLAVRVYLAPGPYFIVVGSASNTRASYRVSASTSTGTDCQLWNFVTPGIEILGNVSDSDCESQSGFAFTESFEFLRYAGDSVTLTLVADSSGYFTFSEACCSFNLVYQELVAAGDSITIGHRAAVDRPYRASFLRDVEAEGPATYRLRIN